MSLIYNGTTIPSSATIKYGGTTLTKIIFNGVTVWTKGTTTTQNFGSHDYYAHQGTPLSGTFNWDVTMTYTGVIKSIALDGSGYGNVYTLYGRKTTSDGWTTIKSNISPNATTTISNTNQFKYLRLSTSGTSYAQWEDPAGNYYWLSASNFRVTYEY